MYTALHDQASTLSLPLPTHMVCLSSKPKSLLLFIYLYSALYNLQVCALTIPFELNALFAHPCMSNTTCPTRLSQSHFLHLKLSLNHQPASLLSRNNLFISLPCNSSLQLDWYSWGSSVTDSSL